MDITIKRLTLNSINPTYGVLFNGDMPLCVTLERPWLDNQHDVSCIPEGTYQCIPHNSQAHPNTWEIMGVPDRTAILIHEANTIADLLGCVGVGTSFFPGGIGESLDALNYLRKMLPANFMIEIINP